MISGYWSKKTPTVVKQNKYISVPGISLSPVQRDSKCKRYSIFFCFRARLGTVCCYETSLRNDAPFGHIDAPFGHIDARFAHCFAFAQHTRLFLTMWETHSSGALFCPVALKILKHDTKRQNYRSFVPQVFSNGKIRDDYMIFSCFVISDSIEIFRFLFFKKIFSKRISEI